MNARDETALRVGLAFACTRPCLTCGDQAQVPGIFWPYDSARWGARPGKQRALFYSLCRRCLDETTLEEREAVLKRRERAA